MLGSRDIIAFLGVTDLARARSFYEEVLGLPLVGEEEGQALVFDANGTSLRITKVPEPARARHTVLGWVVRDIGKTAQALAAQGVSFARYEGFSQDELGVWKASDGTRVAWFPDPDGNILSLTQFPG